MRGHVVGCVKPAERAERCSAAKRHTTQIGRFLRQGRVAHQVAVALAGGLAAFVDGVDDQALAPATVTCGKDAFFAGGKLAILGLEITSGVNLETERIGQGRLGADKTPCEKD